jgi:hypothetical protein
LVLSLVTFAQVANETDSLALIALYNSTDGANWTHTWDITQPVNNWYGVTLYGNGRVTELHLNSNNLNGTIPAEIGNLTNLQELYLNYNQFSGAIPSEISNLINLQYLYLNDNQFEDLPDLSGLSYLSNFEVQNNRLTFEDIEPNVSVLTNYSPQAKVGTVQNYALHIGDNLDLSVTVGGTANTYQWYKDGNPISGATSDTNSITNYDPTTDAGVYYCLINNTIASDLTLQSENITVSTVQYQVTATANPIEGGLVEGGGTYDEGASATLTATANPGYRFVCWTSGSDTVSTDSVYSFIVTQDSNLVANFVVTSLVSENRYVGVTIYPNPAIDVVNILIDDVYRMSLFDASGKLIKEAVLHSKTNHIDISSLDSGVYLIKLTNDRKIFIYRIFKG